MILIAALALALQTQTAYGAPGPYEVDDRDLFECTVFAPKVLGQGGVKHPVILWGNGTTTPVAAYAPLLRHWASHGFVVAAAKTGQAGSGFDLLRCLDRVAASPMAKDIDLSKVGASGHSQGGSGALMAARDKRIGATAPLQPGGRLTPEAIAAQTAPMFLLSGGVDTTAPPDRAQAPVFEGATSSVVWGILKGASHTSPLRNPGPYVDATTAWFRWKLMGDAAAGAWFEGEACGLCRDQNWTIRRK